MSINTHDWFNPEIEKYIMLPRLIRNAIDKKEAIFKLKNELNMTPVTPFKSH